MTRFTRWLVMISLLAGAFAGGTAMYAAWQHNPQCAIHCSELGIAWGYWFAIGSSWAIPAGLFLFVLIGAPAYVVHAVLRHKSSGRAR